MLHNLFLNNQSGVTMEDIKDTHEWTGNMEVPDVKFKEINLTTDNSKSEKNFIDVQDHLL